MTKEEVINNSELPQEFKDHLHNTLNSENIVLGKASAVADEQILFTDSIRLTVKEAVETQWENNEELFLNHKITKKYLFHFFIDLFVQMHLELEITMWNEIKETLKAEI